MSQVQFFKVAKSIRDLENTIYEVRLKEKSRKDKTKGR